MQGILWAQRIASPFFDVFFEAFTQLGETIPLMAAILIALWLGSGREGWRAAWALCISLALCTALKNIFQVERPWVLYGDAIRVLRQETATGFSFPSGHTASAAAVWLSLGFSTKSKWMRAASIAVVLGVAFSRMYLGVHTLLDVAVGAAVGAGAAYLAPRLIHWMDRRHMRPLVCALAGATSILMLFVRDADFIKVLGGFFGFSLGYWLHGKLALDAVELRLGQRLVKLILGFCALLGVYMLLKWWMGDNLYLGYVRYFVVAFLAAMVMDWVFARGFARKNGRTDAPRGTEHHE